jgi:glycosyltransferase involved in cell wall biosynthesis
VQDQIEKRFAELALPHVELDTKKYPLEELPTLMAPCHVSLGQLEKHERLERTIPHKAFESAAMCLPYISARYPAISELLTEGASALMFSPGNARELADAILTLYKDKALREKIAEGGYRAYQEKASQGVLGREFLALLKEAGKKA